LKIIWIKSLIVNADKDIMRAFVINLDRRVDRLDAISSVMSKAGLDFERVSAVDGKRVNFSDVALPLIAKWYIGRRLAAGAVGCFLSHRKIWREMLENNISQALILEDDAQMVEWDPRILEINLQDLDLDLLRISANHLRNLVTHKPLRQTSMRVLDRSLSTDPTAGAGAYIITLDGARKCLKVRKIWFPMDHFDIWSAYYGVKTALVYPVLFKPSGSASDIHPERQRSSIEKLLRYVYRLPLRAFRKGNLIYLKHFGQPQYP
jgi:glycosyl transferase, family 25